MPTLHLIPSPIGKPVGLAPEIGQLDYFIIENLREARRFLKSCFDDLVVDEKQYLLINKNEIDQQAISLFLEKAKKSSANVGLLSDAGVPCVADPGSWVVHKAHELGFTIKPHVGPSSLLLALMASGFNGQSFSFHGYLPIDEFERRHTLIKLEKQSQQENRTLIFIETPYRNNQLLKTCIQHLQPKTQLCIAADLDTDSEEIISQYCRKWKSQTADFHKRPAVFLLYAGK